MIHFVTVSLKSIQSIVDYIEKKKKKYRNFY